MGEPEPFQLRRCAKAFFHPVNKAGNYLRFSITEGTGIQLSGVMVADVDV
jgi:hypothetical protein